MIDSKCICTGGRQEIYLFVITLPSSLVLAFRFKNVTSHIIAKLCSTADPFDLLVIILEGKVMPYVKYLANRILKCITKIGTYYKQINISSVNSVWLTNSFCIHTIDLFSAPLFCTIDDVITILWEVVASIFRLPERKAAESCSWGGFWNVC